MSNVKNSKEIPLAFSHPPAKERRMGSFCDIHYRWQLVSESNTITAAVDPARMVLAAFRMQTFFGGPYSPSAPGKLYSYLGDYVGDPLPSPPGSEALKGRRANYFSTRSSIQIEFRDGGGGGRGDVDDGDENEISLVEFGPLRANVSISVAN